MDAFARIRQPPWVAGLATVLSYGLGLLSMFVLLFVVPFLLFLFV